MRAKFLLVKGFCLTFLLFSQTLLAASVGVDIQAIEKNIEKAMKTFEVPGVAVAVVKDDRVVISKGFGEILQGSRQSKPVNADTLFGIASNTKAFTAAALSILVDEGKLSWNDKIIEHLPEFQLSDPYVSRQLTVRDMLSHRSGLGLGAGDLLIWPTTNITIDEIIKRVRHIQPDAGLRDQYAYNNIMFVLAGVVIERVSGMSWHSFVSKRILAPLQMNDTRMMFSQIDKDNRNVAKPHAHVEGKLQRVGGNFLENFASAGSMASSVNDMSKWLLMQLRGGTVMTDGKEQRILSVKQQQQMWHPNIMRSISSFDELHHQTHFRGYGLGWGLNDHHGHKVVSHTGGILGMVSRVVLVPEAGLGMVVLTNQQSGSAFMAITTDILNRFLGVEGKDWVSVYQQRTQDRVESAGKKVDELMNNRNKDSKPSLPLKAYAQTYRDDWYGDIEIKRNDDKPARLKIQFSRTGDLAGTLEHYQYNTFIIRWHDRSLNADAFINFQIDNEGEVEQATIERVSSMTDFSFDFQDLLLKPKF